MSIYAAEVYEDGVVPYPHGRPCFGFLKYGIDCPKAIYWWVPERTTEEMIEAVFPRGHSQSPEWELSKDLDSRVAGHKILKMSELTNILRRPMMIRLFALRNALCDFPEYFNRMQDRGYGLRESILLGGSVREFTSFNGTTYVRPFTGDPQVIHSHCSVESVRRFMNLEFHEDVNDVWDDCDNSVAYYDTEDEDGYSEGPTYFWNGYGGFGSVIDSIKAYKTEAKLGDMFNNFTGNHDVKNGPAPIEQVIEMVLKKEE